MHKYFYLYFFYCLLWVWWPYVQYSFIFYNKRYTPYTCGIQYVIYTYINISARQKRDPEGIIRTPGLQNLYEYDQVILSRGGGIYICIVHITLTKV